MPAGCRQDAHATVRRMVYRSRFFDNAAGRGDFLQSGAGFEFGGPVAEEDGRGCSIEQTCAVGKVQGSGSVARGEWLSVVDEEGPACFSAGQIAETAQSGQEGSIEGR